MTASVKENQFTFTGRGYVLIWSAFYVTALLSPQLRVLRGNSDFLDKYTAGRLLLTGQSRNSTKLKFKSENSKEYSLR